MAAQYPSLYEAIQSARQIKQVIESRAMGQNVPLLVADLWTVQGFSCWYTFGAPRAPIGQPLGMSAPAPPFVDDQQFLSAVDGFLTSAPEDGNLQTFGASAGSVNWRSMIVWTSRAILLWLAQETQLGVPSAGRLPGDSTYGLGT